MSQRFTRYILCTLSVSIASSVQVAFADWSSFRNGGSSQVASTLPTSWSPTQGIAWQRELIGYGQSTPAVHNDKIFLAAVEGAMKENCVIQCLDMKRGNELWKFTFESANKAASNYAASRKSLAIMPAQSSVAIALTTLAKREFFIAWMSTADTPTTPSDLGRSVLSVEEVPVDFQSKLARIDKNGDGSVDKDEMKAMAESFAARRADSTTEARDPIVYGAVASDGKILVRTGTRLYCIQ